MKEMKNKNAVCVAIFAVMFVFLQMQFHQVMVYFDDYGYYSLSYGMTQAVGGHEFGIQELISYLKVHYFDVNGRIPGYLLWLSLYMIGGLTLVQMTAATIVTVILFVLWKFINSKDHPVMSAILVCAFYGLISLNMHKQGTYWFAAFFQYVAPVAAIVLFADLYFKNRENGFTITKSVVLVMLAFVSAYSQEQLSVTVTFMMCLLLVYELLNKKAKSINLIFVITAALGVAALLLSPSSQNRAAGSGYTLIETMVYSTYKTIRTFFAADISLLVILLYFAVFMFSLELFSEDKRIMKLLDFCGIILALISILIYVFKPVLEVFAQITFNRYYLLIVVGVPSVALIAIQIMRYYWKKRQDARLLLFMTAVGSVGCLCVVPEVPARLFIPSWMLLFPLLSDGLFVMAERLNHKKEKQGLSCLIALSTVIAVLSIVNAGQIYSGYAHNAEVYRYNDAQLTAAAEQEDAGVSVEKVFLKTLPVPECAATLIYDDEVVYMKHWMGIYYDFESVPAFYFSQLGLEDSQTELYHHQGNNVFLKMNEGYVP